MGQQARFDRLLVGAYTEAPSFDWSAWNAQMDALAANAKRLNAEIAEDHRRSMDLLDGVIGRIGEASR